MLKYSNFTQQNIAPFDARRIGVYNSRGNRVGQIPLGNLTKPDTGEKHFSFLLLSDVHVVLDTGAADFARALDFAAKDDTIAFTCISGDLQQNGTEEELAQYKSIVDNHAAGKPVYACAGNHEYYNQKSSGYLAQYTGYPLCYTFTQGDHIFIMVGVSGGDEDQIFADGQLQWLYETLEANRDKHCWVVEHILAPEGCGDVLGLYPYAKLSGTEGAVFKSLLKHYRNTIFVHGHSHMQFDLQKYGMAANYDNVFGIHSIHIPSCAVPRRNANSSTTSFETCYEGSEGYVVDVYENGIHLRGRDFVKGEFLPIASYWLDTPLKTIEAGTYTDSTGTIIP